MSSQASVKRRYVYHALCVMYSSLMPGRIKVPPEKVLEISPKGVKVAGERLRQRLTPECILASICGLQLICHGLSQGKVKSLIVVEGKKLSKRVHYARVHGPVCLPSILFPSPALLLRGTDPCRLLFPGSDVRWLLPGCSHCRHWPDIGRGNKRRLGCFSSSFSASNSFSGNT